MCKDLNPLIPVPFSYTKDMMIFKKFVHQLENERLAFGKGCSKPSLAGLKIGCFCVIAVFGIPLVSMQKACRIQKFMAVAFRNSIYCRSSNEPSGGGLMFNVPHFRLSCSI